MHREAGDRGTNLLTGELLTVVLKPSSTSQGSSKSDSIHVTPVARVPSESATVSAPQGRTLGEESSGDGSQEPLQDDLPPSPPNEPPAGEPTPTTVGEIRLLNATRIPSGYQKMV